MGEFFRQVFSKVSTFLESNITPLIHKSGVPLIINFFNKNYERKIAFYPDLGESILRGELLTIRAKMPTMNSEHECVKKRKYEYDYESSPGFYTPILGARSHVRKMQNE
jgi:hypothetical protein